MPRSGIWRAQLPEYWSSMLRLWNGQSPFSYVGRRGLLTDTGLPPSVEHQEAQFPRSGVPGRGQFTGFGFLGSHCIPYFRFSLQDAQTPPSPLDRRRKMGVRGQKRSEMQTTAHLFQAFYKETGGEGNRASGCGKHHSPRGQSMRGTAQTWRNTENRSWSPKNLP